MLPPTTLLLAMMLLAVLVLLLAAVWRRERRRTRAISLQVMRLGKQLEQSRSDLAAQLNDQTTQLRAQVAALESFNRAVAHDLRSPLYGIEGLAHLARQALLRGDPSAGRILQVIAEQATAGLQLLDALMRLASANHVALCREMVDSHRLVLQVVDELARSRAVARRALKVEPLPPVLADAALLRQVFVNLLGNAMKFTQDSPSPEIQVQGWIDAEWVVFKVRDNGIGFLPSEAAQLFKPFRRLEGRRFEGSGLGLAIVRQIAERHGGSAWAEANPDGGASFHVSLPVHPAPEAPAPTFRMEDTQDA